MPPTGWPVSGCSVTMPLRNTAVSVVPVRMSMPTPIAPWCRFAFPSEMRVGRRTIAITGTPM